jgi:hypothetical protein
VAAAMVHVMRIFPGQSFRAATCLKKAKILTYQETIHARRHDKHE